MRICFISHLPWKGGAESALIETIDALRDQGVECCAIVPFWGSLISALRERAIPTAVIPFGWWVGRGFRPGLRVLQSVAIVLSIIPITLKIRAWQCDIVYTNTICTCVGAIAARLLRLIHIWHIHEFGFEDHRLRFYFGERFSTRVMERFSCLCITNSYAVTRAYSKYIDPSRLVVIYQSVTLQGQDTPLPPQIPLREESSGVLCMMVGKVHERKGHEEAIRAIGGLGSECRARLVVVGGGSGKYVRRLLKLARECGIGDRVAFTGHVENPSRLIAESDVLLVCSRAEAFGRTTVEAMKLGRPVIGAKSGGTLEIIQDGSNGFLYAPGDYKDLGEKILFLERHPELRRAMGERAYAWAAGRFTRSQYGQALVGVLERCTDSSPLIAEH